MVNDSQFQAIEAMVVSVLEAEPTYFLVEMKIKPTANIQLFLDGDAGVTIEKCVQINRALYRKIEDAALFNEGDFSLEVSSAGLDKPLKLVRQFRKNVGRKVDVVLLDGTEKEGILLEVSEDGIVIEESKGKNKKKEIIRHAFLFINIKSTKIQSVF
jgi:ribosome maturation factor RimP